MFLCDKCGLCCEHVNENLLGEGLDRGDGVCMHFDEKDHICSIYSERPIFCNVDKAYEKYFTNRCTREEFYKINYMSCEKLKERYGK